MKKHTTVVPMLMQLAQPEYMCTNCGDKFYIDTEYKGVYPVECRHCHVLFNWNDAKKL